MRLPTVLAPLLAVTASMAALAPLNPPVPLASPEPAASPGEGAFDLLSAQRSEDCLLYTSSPGSRRPRR